MRVVDIIPNIYTDIRYATDNNFTGETIYDSPEVYLRYSTALKLSRVQERLNAQGYSLCIWDGWRPVAAQFTLWRVCPDARYVANPFNGVGNHCRGNTVDITLVTLAGERVEMPTDFDNFTGLADRDYSDVSAQAAENARLLNARWPPRASPATPPSGGTTRTATATTCATVCCRRKRLT